MDVAQGLWVFVWGGLGSVVRFGIATLVAARLGPGFPWGTLAVNVVGSALLAALLQAAMSSAAITPNVRIALSAGFLGGFTTYSAFSNETLALLQRGDASLAAGYVALTLVGCLVACWIGQTAMRALVT
jgi:CrcB protein